MSANEMLAAADPELDLSVCLVNINSKDLTLACLRSIYRHVRGVRFEVLVVDNASNDGSADAIAQAFPPVKVFRVPELQGFSANNNVAIRQSRGRYVLVLNNDTYLSDDIFTPMVAFMNAHPRCGAAGCQLRSQDGSLQLVSARHRPTWKTCLWDQLLLTQLFPRSRIFGAEYLTDAEYDGEPREVEVLSGACMLVRRETIAAVGLLDEGYRLYYEDIDWSVRISDGGWQVYYLPHLALTHLGDQTIFRARERGLIEWYKGAVRYARKFRRADSAHLALLRFVRLFSLGERLMISSLFLLSPAQRSSARQGIRAYLGALRWHLRDERRELASAEYISEASTARIRLIYLIDGLREDGAQKALWEMCKHLDRKRFAVSVVSLSGRTEMLPLFSAIGVPVLALGLEHPWQIGRLASLYRYLRHERPLVVNTMVDVGNTLGLTVAALARVPVRVASLRVTYLPTQQAMIWLHRFSLRLAHGVTAVSSATGHFAVRKLGVPERKLRVIFNGIDSTEFVAAAGRQEAEPLASADCLTVGTVGRLTEQKGHRYLLSAAREVVENVASARFVIAGEGPLGPALQAEAARSELAQHISFPGRLPRQRTIELMAHFDVFVLPSLYEGMSNSLLEAMALGRPVVASAVDGALDLIDDGTTGLLVPAGDPKALARALTRLLQDPELRARLGNGAQARVRSAFNLDVTVEQFITLYQQLIAARLRREKPAS